MLRVHEEIADLKRPGRVGVITAIHSKKVEVQWNTGATTTIGRQNLRPNSRHYAVTSAQPRPTGKELPSTVRACITMKGSRCLVCRRYCKGPLLRPWRALYWNLGVFAGKSTLVCGDRCHERLRRRMASPEVEA